MFEWLKRLFSKPTPVADTQEHPLSAQEEATFTGLRRTDQRDYPEEAVREALLNSIIHRDFLFSVGLHSWRSLLPGW